MSIERETIIFSVFILVALVMLFALLHAILKTVRRLFITYVKENICAECNSKLETIKRLGDVEQQMANYGHGADFEPVQEVSCKFVCSNCKKEFSYEDL